MKILSLPRGSPSSKPVGWSQPSGSNGPRDGVASGSICPSELSCFTISRNSVPMIQGIGVDVSKCYQGCWCYYPVLYIFALVTITIMQMETNFIQRIRMVPARIMYLLCINGTGLINWICLSASFLPLVALLFSFPKEYIDKNKRQCC